MTRGMGRQMWLRERRRLLDGKREQYATPIPRLRAERLTEVKRRLDEEFTLELAANACYEAYRVGGRMKDGPRLVAAQTPTNHRWCPMVGSIPPIPIRADAHLGAARRAGLQRPGRDERAGRSSSPPKRQRRGPARGRRSVVGSADPRVQPEHRQRTHDDLDARSIPARGPEGTSTTDWHGDGAA